MYKKRNRWKLHIFNGLQFFADDNNGFAEILNEIVRYAHDEILAKLGWNLQCRLNQIRLFSRRSRISSHKWFHPLKMDLFRQDDGFN